MTRVLNAIFAMAYRQVLRLLRTPSRLIAATLTPVIWLLLFGMGFSSFLSAMGSRVNYLSYLAPGIIALSVFNGGVASGFTVIFDRQFGFLRETLVAPVPRWAVILGRAIGDAANATIHVIPIMAVIIPLTGVSPIAALKFLPICYLSALTFTSFGILVASKLSTHESFQMVMTFFMMPAAFFSNVFYPISTMPNWMRLMAYLNPLTYSSDLIRAVAIGVCELGVWRDLTILTAFTITLLALACIAFERASIED